MKNLLMFLSSWYKVSRGTVRRGLIVFVLLCSGCCLSSETTVLARQIADSAATQSTELAEVADLLLTEQGERILLRAAKLEEATSGLADILGAPKEIE